jgi:hypothetical protein|tara:strand:- start:862 stop:978 length:117 start_codon:yes stop_codon:yes gene_type:complete
MIIQAQFFMLPYFPNNCFEEAELPQADAATMGWLLHEV